MVLRDVEKLKKELRFAASIMKRMPSAKVQGYKLFWPDIKHSEKERMCWEVEEPRIAPSRSEIAFLDAVLVWYEPLEPFETKLVWLKSCGIPWKVLTHKFGYGRSNLIEKYNNALSKMLICIAFQKKMTVRTK